MLIGLETSNLHGNVTGTGRYITCLYDTLVYSGSHVVAFSPVKYNGRVRNRVLKNYYRQLKITGKMNRAEMDCAIFPDYFLPLNFNLPAAIVIHDLSFISHPGFYSRNFVRFYKSQLYLTLRKNPLIITVSEYSKQQIIKYLNINENDIFIVQGYVDKHITDHPDAPKNIPYFLYAGHIEPRKNLDFLIRNFLSWRRSRNIEIKLKIVGALWIKSKGIPEMLHKYQDDPSIEFTGYVPEEKLNDYYMNAAGFVHTSIEEGFGFPVLEAMSYNLPVLCSEEIATSEISGTQSIKINPQNDSSLLNGLDKLYDLYMLEKRIEYSIPYSQNLMNYQLQAVLSRLNEKADNKVYTYSRALNSEEAIEKSLVYSTLFNSGINKSDLPKALFDVKLEKDQLDPVLLKMTYEGKIINTDDYVKLIYENSDLYESKHKNIDIKAAKKILKLINLIPFISSICFSGGTAHYGIENHDDVDLFIITRPYTVYIVYLMIHLLSLIFRVRSRFCANYLIDESKLKLTGQRDFYTAHQIISLKPYKDNGAYGLFIFRNSWVNYFFPNFEIRNTGYSPKIFIYRIFSPLNFLIKIIYKLFYSARLKKQQGSLYFTGHSIKLHTNDHRDKIIRLFDKAWEKYRKNRAQILNEPGETKLKAL